MMPDILVEPETSSTLWPRPVPELKTNARCLFVANDQPVPAGISLAAHAAVC